ncbi:MAG: ABC transporter ATP-binding protein [Sulfurospirillum sp.]|nr:ABC transporter ATP-binding protein [Sulfurospirillum sp.]
MSCSLDLKNVSVANEGVILFENISLHVGHKEKIAIVGANGCGKTTLLEVLAGLREKTSGRLELFHHTIEKKSDYQPFRSMVGYLFQDSNDQFLCPIVKDDIAFSLLARGMQKSMAAKRVAMILEDLHITHLSEKVVYSLSGGEKKLVALAGVLVCEPKLLLLDEPTNALDELMQTRLTQILLELEKSIVVVSHDKDFVKEFSQSIYTVKERSLVRIA